jgi:hypothetical protein
MFWSRPMKALGQDSISSYLRIALDIARIVMIVGLFALAIGSTAYLGGVYAIRHGWISAALLHSDHVKVAVSGDAKDPLDWPTILPALIGAGISLGGALVIVDRLRAMFDSFRNNDPFRSENSDHLRAIWIALAVIELSKVVTYELRIALTVAFSPGGMSHKSFHFSVDLTTWFMVFVLMVLAEVFREGARLRDEQTLTV